MRFRVGERLVLSRINREEEVVPSPLGERARLKIPPQAGVRGSQGEFNTFS